MKRFKILRFDSMNSLLLNGAYGDVLELEELPEIDPVEVVLEWFRKREDRWQASERDKPNALSKREFFARELLAAGLDPSKLETK